MQLWAFIQLLFLVMGYNRALSWPNKCKTGEWGGYQATTHCKHQDKFSYTVYSLCPFLPVFKWRTEDSLQGSDFVNRLTFHSPRAQLSAAALRRPSKLRQMVSLSLWLCSFTPSAPRMKARPLELPAMRPVRGVDSTSIRFFHTPVRMKRDKTAPEKHEQACCFRDRSEMNSFLELPPAWKRLEELGKEIKLK